METRRKYKRVMSYFTIGISVHTPSRVIMWVVHGHPQWTVVSGKSAPQRAGPQVNIYVNIWSWGAAVAVATATEWVYCANPFDCIPIEKELQTESRDRFEVSVQLDKKRGGNLAFSVLGKVSYSRDGDFSTDKEMGVMTSSLLLCVTDLRTGITGYLDGQEVKDNARGDCEPWPIQSDPTTGVQAQRWGTVARRRRRNCSSKGETVEAVRAE